MQGWTVPAQETQPETRAANAGVGTRVVTPADLSKLLFKRKWLILIVALAGTAVGLYHALTTTPLYEATNQVYIELGKSNNLGIGTLQPSYMFDMPDVLLQTQVQIMRSDTVAMDAIEMLDLYHKAPFSDVFKKEPYTGKLSPKQRAALLGQFKGATKISVLPNTGLVNVNFRNPDPVVAKNVANAIVDAYMKRDLQARYQGTTRVSEWLGQQLAGLKKQAEANQKAFSDYVQEHNIVSTGEQGGSLVKDTLQTVNQQLSEAKADRIVKEARYKMAETRNPELLVSVAPGTILSSLRQQQAELMVQKAQLQSKFGPQYPKVQELGKQLASVQSDIDAEITNLTKRFAEEYHTALRTEDLLQTRLNALTKTAYKENESAAQFDILKHNAESAAELYNALDLKLQEAGITAGMNSNGVDVVDSATVPPTPVLPAKKKDVLFGFIGGLLVGLLAAFLLEYVDDTLQTSEEVEALSHLPTLAVVPHFAKKNESPVRGAGIPNVSPELVAYLTPQSLEAESYRTLRSAVLLSAVDREPKVLLITSSFAGEGKSTTAANLAVSFAQRQEKVLLIDTDLRRGTTHLKFGLSNRRGLSTVLAKESGGDAYEHPLPDLPWLTVLSRGPIPPNPGEALGSRTMEDLLEQWRGEYDRVILDCPPVLAVSDSLALVPQVDNVLVLVRSGVTRKKALLRTQDWLRRAGGRIAGAVINDVNLRLENYYTYSGRYGYGYESISGGADGKK